MRFDFSAVDLFLDYLAGRHSVDEVLNHPAYATVREHARHFGGVELAPEHVEQGLSGLPSPLYGLGTVRDSLDKIRNLREYLPHTAETWSTLAGKELRSLLPQADTDSIVVYPIIGYDAGIGLSDKVCMNLAYPPYRDTPTEFLSTMIHEGFHVLYERIHGRARVHGLVSPQEWRGLCLSMLQNEGLAVYAPYQLRLRHGYGVNPDIPMQRDYAYLSGKLDSRCLVEDFHARLALLDRGDIPESVRFEAVFGSSRLTYRVGGILVQRVDQAMGRRALSEAIMMPPEEYWQKYHHLLQ